MLLKTPDNHGRNLLRIVSLHLIGFLNAYFNSIVLVSYHLEWPQFHVFLYLLARKSLTNKPLRVKDCVQGVFETLDHGSMPDRASLLGKRYHRWRRVHTLLTLDDDHSVILVNSHTGISGAEVNADGHWILFYLI